MRSIFRAVRLSSSEVYAVDIQGRQALFQRAARLCCIKTAGVHVAIQFGRDDEARRKPAAFANDLADSFFAAPETIVAGRVYEINWTCKNCAHRFSRPFGIDRIAIGIRHITEGGGTETDPGHSETGAAHGDPIQRI
jgi:hypothetical protein